MHGGRAHSRGPGGQGGRAGFDRGLGPRPPGGARGGGGRPARHHEEVLQLRPGGRGGQAQGTARCLACLVGQGRGEVPGRGLACGPATASHGQPRAATGWALLGS
ncbi:MAG: hypothetical protein QF615_11045 [Planctomycetota bacterium]|nr:hypothetical protein [Planctomycetota bacterium]